MSAVLLFLAVLSSSLSRADEALKYEPAIVTLQGVLSLQDFAGPPNYESVARGDELERYWILTLPKSIQMLGSSDDSLLYPQDRVKEIQLVCSEGCGKDFSFVVGAKVTLVGTLYAAFSGHHHKGVLMKVQKVK